MRQLFPHLKIPVGRDKARGVSKGRGAFIRKGAFVRERRSMQTCQLGGALISLEAFIREGAFIRSFTVFLLYLIVDTLTTLYESRVVA